MIKNNPISFVFLVSLAICITGIGSYPIYILDEAKNSEAAREMLVSLDFIVPRFNGYLRADKPPLHYYFMVLGYKIFGINAFGARFFSAVFGALTFTTSFYFIRKFSGVSIAWISLIILCSSIFFVQEFHLAVPDPYLIFFVSTGLWLLYDVVRNQNPWKLILMYVCFSLGFLTKGPIAIALPGLIGLLFLISIKSFTVYKLKKLNLFLGVVILVLICLPWYYLVDQRTNGAWTEGFFLNHNINRFGSKMEGHGGIFLITWAFVLLGLMPFSFFIFYAIKKTYFQIKQKNNFLLYCSLVSIVFIVFFSFSGTKLPNYTMPCYPFLVFVIAYAIHDIYSKKEYNLFVTLTISFIVLISLALPIVGYFALDNEKELADSKAVAFWLLPVTIFTILGSFYYIKKKLRKSFIFIALGWILLSPILFTIVYPILTEQSPVLKAKPFLKNVREIAVYERFDAAFPINYQQTYKVLRNKEDITSFFNKYPKGKILTNTRNLEDFIEIESVEQVFECKALFESHTTRIFKRVEALK